MIGRLLTVIFLFASLLCRGQQAPVYTHEFSFTTENDAYLLQEHDAYYTNGVFLRFTTADAHNGRKVIRSYEAAQMIYTPLTRRAQSTADIDRPYCGFLYGRYSRAVFTHSDAVLQYSGTLGVVGAASLGETMQESYHSLLGYSQFNGWKYQVRNAIGFDIGLLYAKTIWEDPSWAKITPAIQISMGSNYTYARIGAYICFGGMEKNSNSILWNARVQSSETTTRRKSELFFYWYPEFEWQGYNATVQGGLFSKGTGAILSQPQRMMLQHTLGLCYGAARWSAKMGIVFQAREAISQKTPQQYGSFQLSYRMR